MMCNYKIENDVKHYVTTPKELWAIVSEAVSGALPKQASSQPQIDTITLNDVLELLKECGYPTSKAKIYKLTSTDKSPAKRTGTSWSFRGKSYCFGLRTRPNPNMIQQR